MTSLHQFAADFAASGVPIFPLKRRNKRPAISNGFLAASTDEVLLARWFKGSANIGIACTPESGSFLVDVDRNNGGLETFALLERELGAFPETPRVDTPGGGFHYYVVHPQDGRGNEAVAGSGIDLRGAGYGVAPPSVHPNGGIYQFTQGRSFQDVGLAELPASWLSRLRGNRSRSVTAAQDPSSFGERASKAVDDTPRRRAIVAEMLAHISPDCSYDHYRNIVWAILSLGWTDCRDLAQAWAQGAAHRFDEGSFHAVTSSYDVFRGPSLGTINHFAKQGGWS